MFNPTNLDYVSVQATHLESRGKDVTYDVGKSSNLLKARIKAKRNLSGRRRKQTL